MDEWTVYSYIGGAGDHNINHGVCSPKINGSLIVRTRGSFVVSPNCCSAELREINWKATHISCTTYTGSTQCLDVEISKNDNPPCFISLPSQLNSPSTRCHVDVDLKIPPFGQIAARLANIWSILNMSQGGSLLLYRSFVPEKDKVVLMIFQQNTRSTCFL